MVFLAILIGTSGCTLTPRQHFYAAQTADLLVTTYGLEEADYAGVNGAKAIEQALVAKVTFIILFESFSYIFPDLKDKVYGTGATMGYSSAAVNTTMFVRDSLIK